MKEDINKNILSSFKITDNDMDFVVSYIKERQTAILVIMFTDIVGYTRITEEKGEKYASTLRAYHDEILTKVIEENSQGKVVKYIGDSVMAIFSEPTKAVEVSIEIHNQLNIFNKEHENLVDIDIRIGLHMGQVAIENNIQSDIFGRHVNRASRIEGLAGAGQVYVSFPVFDSAKGWLQDLDHLGWKFHGEYYLKGIDKPSEIYEVFDKNRSSSKAPVKGKKRRVVPSFIFLILTTFLGIGIGLGFQNFKKTEVYFFDYGISDTKQLDGSTLFLDGEKGDNKRKILSKLDKGKNILYFEVSAITRYYTEIEVERGVNLLEPEFNRFDLPTYDLTYDFSTVESIEDNIPKNFSYYSDLGEKIDVRAELKIKINKTVNNSINNYKLIWELILDGSSIGSDTIKFSHDTKSKSYSREDFKTVVELEKYDFEMKYLTYKERVQFKINGLWK